MARLPKYTPKKLEKAVKEYLESCDNLKKMPNRAGLCVFLGITKETYYQYKKKKKLSDYIKKFEENMQDVWVSRLNASAPAGAIFYLKNAFRDEFKDRYENKLEVKNIGDLLDKIEEENKEEEKKLYEDKTQE